MKLNFITKLLLVASTASVLSGQAEARTTARIVANNDTQGNADETESEEKESSPAIQTKRRPKQANRTNAALPSEGYSRAIIVSEPSP